MAQRRPATRARVARRGVGRAEDNVIGELVRLARMATDEQPVIPGRLLQAHQAHPRPIVDRKREAARILRELMANG